MTGGENVIASIDLDGSGDYLSRTTAEAGNQKTWTYSTWVKRDSTSASEHTLFSVGSQGHMMHLAFSNNKLETMNYDGSGSHTSGFNWYLISQESFTDTNAWYHVVMMVDTTAASGDFVRLYVNGDEIALERNWQPSSDFAGVANEANTHYVGSRPDGYQFDGQMAGTAMVDGQALGPDQFGQDVGGTWSPISYSGDHGTNGFNLDFSNSQSLGEDGSGQGNDLTVTGDPVGIADSGLKETLPGGATLTGGSGDDTLVGGAGDDTLTGGSGEDTARYDGVRADHDIINNGDGTITVKKGGIGSDRLSGIEKIHFDENGDGIVDDGETVLEVSDLGRPVATAGKISYPADLSAGVDSFQYLAVGDAAGPKAGQSDHLTVTLDGAEGTGLIQVKGGTIQLVDSDGNAVASNSDGRYKFTAGSHAVAEESFSFTVTGEHGLTAGAEMQVETIPQTVWTDFQTHAITVASNLDLAYYHSYGALRFGDLNGDGIQDLALVDYDGLGFGSDNENRVKVLYGEADGFYGASNGVRDLDNGGADLVFNAKGDSNSGDQLNIELLDSNGGGKVEVAMSNSIYVRDIDFEDIDTIADSTTVSTLTHPSTGSFSSGSSSIVFADFNGDGHLDLFSGGVISKSGTAGPTETSFAGWFGAEDGFSGSADLTAYTNLTGNGSMHGQALGALDFNGDGYADIVATGGSSNNGYVDMGIKVTYGNVAGNFEQNLNSATGGVLINNLPFDHFVFSRMASGSGDVNGDGYQDLALFNQEEATAHVYFGGGGISGEIDHAAASAEQSLTISNAGGDIRAMAMGDLDGDGLADLVLGVDGADGGNGGVWIVRGQEGGWDDGQLDLATAGTDQAVFMAGSNGEGLGYDLAVSDMDGDGRLDILAGSKSGNQNLYALDNADILAALGRGAAIGTAGNDILHDQAGPTVLNGGLGDDLLIAGAGDDTLIGGWGEDTARFAGTVDDYTVTDKRDGTYSVSSAATGSDSLTGVEKLHFDANNDGVVDEGELIDLTEENGPIAGDAKVVLKAWESVTHKLTVSDADLDKADSTEVLSYEVVGAVSEAGGVYTLASGATVSIDAEGNYTYSPAATAQPATDSFTWRASDTSGMSAEGKVSLQGAPVAYEIGQSAGFDGTGQTLTQTMATEGNRKNLDLLNLGAARGSKPEPNIVLGRQQCHQ